MCELKQSVPVGPLDEFLGAQYSWVEQIRVYRECKDPDEREEDETEPCPIRLPRSTELESTIVSPL